MDEVADWFVDVRRSPKGANILLRIIQERETREKLKKEKAEVCLHNPHVNDRWLTFPQREAKEKKEVWQ